MKNKLFSGRLQQRFASIFVLSLLSILLAGCQVNASKIAKQYQKGESLILTGTFIQYCSPAQETG